MMFRELTRKKQALSREECITILKEEKRGVLAVLGDDDHPYAVPLNHFYNDEDGKIYFHGGMTGHKIDAMKRHPKVSFCVMDEGHRQDGEWFLRIKSVIVFGKISFIDDAKTVEDISRKLCHKFTQDEDYIEGEIRKSLSGTLMFALEIEHMSGKIVKEC